MQIRMIALLACGVSLAGLAGCGGSSVFGGSGSPTHNAYVTVTESGIYAYRIESNTGKFTPVLGSPFAGGNSPTSIQSLPSRNLLYVANTADSTISLFNVNSTSGALTEVLPRTSTGLTPVSILVNSAGTFLFSINQISSNISVFSIDSGTGALKAISGSPFAINPRPVSAAITPSGKFLYVNNPNISLIYAYSISSTGALQSVAGSPFSVVTGTLGMAIDPGGKFLFAANSSANTVSVFSINGSTGALIAAPESPFTAGTGPISLAVSADSNYLYVDCLGSSNLYAYSIASNGVLTQLLGSPYGAGTQPVFVATDPSDKFVYVGNQSGNTITEFSVDTGSGELTGTGFTATMAAAPSSMTVWP
ncbi:MAG: beta-propeller fold lactonase family protein [Terriglobales bacterium]